MSKLTRTCVALVAFASFTAVAEGPSRAPPADAAKVHQTDRYGNVQYHKPSAAVQPDGKVIQTDPHGNRVRQQYEVQGDRVYATDQVGNRAEPKFIVKGDRVHQTDKYGNAQYDKPSYEVQPDGKVMKIDRYGNRLQQQFEVRGDRRAPAKSADGKSSPESARK